MCDICHLLLYLLIFTIRIPPTSKGSGDEDLVKPVSSKPGEMPQEVSSFTNVESFMPMSFSQVHSEPVIRGDSAPGNNSATANVEIISYDSVPRLVEIQEQIECLEEERRSRMEPDGARNPSPLSSTKPRV